MLKYIKNRLFLAIELLDKNGQLVYRNAHSAETNRVVDWCGEKERLIRKSLTPPKTYGQLPRFLTKIFEFQSQIIESPAHVHAGKLIRYDRQLPRYDVTWLNTFSRELCTIALPADWSPYHRFRSRTDRRRGQAIDFAITKATGIHHRESYSANIIYGPLICTQPPFPRKTHHVWHWTRYTPEDLRRRDRRGLTRLSVLTYPVIIYLQNCLSLQYIHSYTHIYASFGDRPTCCIPPHSSLPSSLISTLTKFSLSTHHLFACHKFKPQNPLNVSSRIRIHISGYQVATYTIYIHLHR